MKSYPIKKDLFLFKKSIIFSCLLFIQIFCSLSLITPEKIPSNIEVLIQKGPQGIEPTHDEKELYRLLSDYRTENGKPIIPLSKSLCYVAQLHVQDLTANKVAPPYTLQSWSKNGPWEGVRYTANHRQARLMWNKPKELTNYSGDGFEITFSRKGGTNARTAFNAWVRQKSVSSIMLNTGNWETITWKAVGVGLHGEFAVIWFGDKEDQ